MPQVPAEAEAEAGRDTGFSLGQVGRVGAATTACGQQQELGRSLAQRRWPPSFLLSLKSSSLTEQNGARKHASHTAMLGEARQAWGTRWVFGLLTLLTYGQSLPCCFK